MKKIFLYIIISVVFIGKSKAQDFHLSLYDCGPLFLNPAMTGVIDAKFRVHAQYRNQWNSVAYKPYNTALISADMPKGKWGFGIQIIEMRAGIGNYNVFQGMLSAAYTVPLDKKKFHQLSFGLQGGFTQKQVEYKLYTWDNQYTSTNGGSFDTGVSPNENFKRQSQVLPQLNAGLLYFFSKQQSRLNPFLGVSGFNLTQPKETFFDQPNRLPIRIYGHGGVRVNISELLYVIPKVLVMSQGSAFEQTYAFDAGYYFKNDKFFLLAGFTYRAKDASIVYAGFRKDNYIFKFGYDFNTSSLKTASKTRGAFEISFTYLAGKKNLKEVRNCPRL
ncbi:MAG: PorP/SprF family type IX secretion system membrane protein [Sphingobacteriaceae bacterium]|nr:PorP/SprF family type IX secretion system membrane protein [Sphingobacteriaceae bacterium]